MYLHDKNLPRYIFSINLRLRIYYFYCLYLSAHLEASKANFCLLTFVVICMNINLIFFCHKKQYTQYYKAFTRVAYTKRSDICQRKAKLLAPTNFALEACKVNRESADLSIHIIARKSTAKPVFYKLHIPPVTTEVR